jgi:hypothetical protein
MQTWGKKNSLHNILPSNSVFGTMYGTLNPQILRISVHRTFLNSLMDTINLKVSVMGGSWDLNRSVIEGLKAPYSYKKYRLL